MKRWVIVSSILVAAGIGAVIGYFVYQHFNATNQPQPSAIPQNATQPQDELIEELPTSKPTQAPKEPEPQTESTPVDKFREAIINGDVKFIKTLIQDGSVNLTTQLREGISLFPIHLACKAGQVDVVKFFIDENVDIDIRDTMFRTPLHWAVFSDHANVVKFLVEHGANLTLRDTSGWSVIHWAAYNSYNGSLDILKILIDGGADVDMENIHQATALHTTCYRGFEDTLRYLIERGADIEHKDSTGFTPLQKAVQGGFTNIVKVLLEKGAKTDSKTNFGEYIFHFADKDEIVKLLIKHGGDINKKGSGGMTALQRAAGWGQEKQVRLLLENGADASIQDDKGDSSVVLALKNGFPNVAELLVQSKQFSPEKWESAVFACIAPKGTIALPAVKNENGTVYDWKDALNDVVNNGSTTAAELLVRYCAKNDLKELREPWPLHIAADRGDEAMAHLLVSSKIDINLQDPRGNTPLIIASSRGDERIVQLLIRKNARTDIASAINWNALQWASYKGHLNVVKELLFNKRTKVNATGQYGNAAIHLASDKGHEKVVELLIRERADVNMTNDQGWTALHWAVFSKHIEVCKVLIKSGIDVNHKSSENGITALYWADRYAEFVHLLLENGADPNVKDDKGRSALHRAALYGLEQSMIALVEHKANIKIRDNHADTPLHLAVQNVYLTLNKAKQAPNTPRRYVLARKDKVGIIEYLIANGAEVNAVNYDYQTPLYSSILGGFYAARNLDKLQVVKTLLKHNANPNISDTNHQTPLHIAAGDPSNGRAEIVKALRNAGAKKDLKNKFGQTPLEIAQEKGYTDVVTLLNSEILETNDIPNASHR